MGCCCGSRPRANLLPIVRPNAKQFLRARSTRRPRLSPRAATRCKDFGPRQPRRTIWPTSIRALGDELAVENPAEAGLRVEVLGHAAGAASYRARRGLPHRGRGAAQRLPPCRCQADRSRASLRRAAASGAGARRRQRHRPGGLARGGAGRTFRAARDARAREARRRQTYGLERAGCGNRGGIEHSRAARVQ